MGEGVPVYFRNFSDNFLARNIYRSVYSYARGKHNEGVFVKDFLCDKDYFQWEEQVLSFFGCGVDLTLFYELDDDNCRVFNSESLDLKIFGERVCADFALEKLEKISGFSFV